MTFALQNTSHRKFATICCCCLKDDCYKNISTEYCFSGQKEIYDIMIRDTFNIQMTQPKDVTNIYFRPICEECITQLRLATNFKQMVLSSEKAFIEYLNICHPRDNVTEDTKLDVSVKVEPQASEMDFDDQDVRDDASLDDNADNVTEDTKLDMSVKVEPQASEMDFDDQDVRDDASLDDNEILSNIKLELSKNNIDDTKPPRRKSHDRKRKIKSKIKKEGFHVNLKDTQKDWSKIVERRGNGPILRENSLKLLTNSTICVFQWNKSQYRCFCCKEPFLDPYSLKEHTNAKHSIKDIEKKIILQQNRLVKVEVSVIHCKLCSEKLNDLDELREHLGETHNIEFVQKEDLLVPFKINNNLQCQICMENFTMFRLLNIHMNKHFQKQVCHICGVGFSNLVFLNLHKTRSHRPLCCKQCGVTFTNKSDKKNHDISIHNAKFERKLRFPCPYCQERFFQENLRVQHLVDRHGMVKPEHKCTVCDKVFITKSLCNNHLKNVHMKEKNQECDICHNFFYTKSDVVRHRVTHTGEKRFLCNICNNPFATKDSLRRHMKRTHAGNN